MISMVRILAGAAALWLFGALNLASAQEAASFRPAMFVARDADSTIYLYGTVHLRRPGGDWGDDAAKAALASAEEVWTEMHIGPEAQAEVQRAVMALGFSDAPLSSRLSAEEYAQLTALAERYGMPVAGLDRMKPWLAALTLSMLPMMQAGYDPEAGVDQGVENAAGEGVRRRAFETAAQQIGFFATMDGDAQMQFLRESIAEASEGVEALDELSIAWERGDLETLERVVIDEFKAEAPGVYDVIITRRNRAWTEVLMTELDGAGVDFVAVGAAHMLGEDGLVALLRARGVSVERVN